MAIAKAPECQHHWLIDKPNGLVSHGICKFCHEERDFSNIPINRIQHGRPYDPEMAAARRAFYERKLLPDPIKRIESGIK